MNRYALVTGGSRGIGRAVCAELAARGYWIIINYARNTEEAQKTLRAVREAGSDGELMAFDVSNEQAATEAIQEWQQRHEGEYIEVLVNNAGVRHDNIMALMPTQEWQSVINTTLNGFFFVTRLLLPMMQYRKYGRIVNVTSVSGLRGLPGQANYSAAKGGLIAATKALAQEVARKKITVNAVAPGFIETDMTAELDADALAKTIPMRRFGKPEEVAKLVAFLASPDAAYITGEVVSINGGMP